MVSQGARDSRERAHKERSQARLTDPNGPSADDHDLFRALELPLDTPQVLDPVCLVPTAWHRPRRGQRRPRREHERVVLQLGTYAGGEGLSRAHALERECAGRMGRGR